MLEILGLSMGLVTFSFEVALFSCLPQEHDVKLGPIAGACYFFYHSLDPSELDKPKSIFSFLN